MPEEINVLVNPCILSLRVNLSSAFQNKESNNEPCFLMASIPETAKEKVEKPVADSIIKVHPIIPKVSLNNISKESIKIIAHAGKIKPLYSYEFVREHISIVAHESKLYKVRLKPSREIKAETRLHRMRRTTFQARMGRKLDNINGLILDNNIRLSAHPTDMIRISTNRDSRSQDVLTRTIIGAEIVPIILPPMENIPLRKYTINQESTSDKTVLIPSLYPYAESTYYEVYTPVEVQLDEDDILIRLIYEKFCDEPYVMALQVKDVLSTLGYGSVLYNKIQVTFYDEELPGAVIELIKDANRKRDELNW